MAGLECLTMVNPHSAALNPMPRGGQPALTKQMVEAALSKMPSHISMYARIKYTLSKEEQAVALQWKSNPHTKPGVFEVLRFTVETKKQDCTWPIDKQKRLVELASITDIMPNICPACQGVKQRAVDDKLIDCELCDATGHIKITQEMCASYIGTDARNFRRRWQGNYYFMLQVLAEWEWVARRIIKSEI